MNVCVYMRLCILVWRSLQLTDHFCYWPWVQRKIALLPKEGTVFVTNKEDLQCKCLSDTKQLCWEFCAWLFKNLMHVKEILTIKKSLGFSWWSKNLTEQQWRHSNYMEHWELVLEVEAGGRMNQWKRLMWRTRGSWISDDQFIHIFLTHSLFSQTNTLDLRQKAEKLLARQIKWRKKVLTFIRHLPLPAVRPYPCIEKWRGWILIRASLLWMA